MQQLNPLFWEVIVRTVLQLPRYVGKRAINLLALTCCSVMHAVDQAQERTGIIVVWLPRISRTSVPNVFDHGSPRSHESGAASLCNDDPPNPDLGSAQPLKPVEIESLSIDDTKLTELETSLGARYWSRFDVLCIPTKPNLHRSFIEFLSGGPNNSNLLHSSQPRLLDLGCGDGRLAHSLSTQGFTVCAVDVNQQAIQTTSLLLHGTNSWAVCADCCNVRLEETFDVVLCQLLISVVGGRDDRQRMLATSALHLDDGGILLLSASGVSDTVNAKYAQLYKQDREATGEDHSYYSRDEHGSILYVTHHFMEQELVDLLVQTGFRVQHLSIELESSSRRPSEVANFLYVVAIKT